VRSLLADKSAWVIEDLKEEDSQSVPQSVGQAVTT